MSSEPSQTPQNETGPSPEKRVAVIRYQVEHKPRTIMGTNEFRTDKDGNILYTYECYEGKHTYCCKELEEDWLIFTNPDDGADFFVGRGEWEDDWGTYDRVTLYKFCPHCGAKIQYERTRLLRHVVEKEEVVTPERVLRIPERREVKYTTRVVESLE